MEVISDSKVKEVFDAYPTSVRKQLLNLRALVLETASEIDGLEKLEETLKWGEPSYLTKHGSTIRMDWKEKEPEEFALYFSCSTSLVETFKIIYRDTFTFSGKRALIFQLNDTLPKAALKHCITLALTYHKVKHLPLLGA